MATHSSYSCLENPVDRGDWWAPLYSVAQSQTWLKWLSMHACIGEENGNPLQYSCLENPRDRGAWWAAVYGFAQSWTRLKWLSSSSSSSPQMNGFPTLRVLSCFNCVWLFETLWTITCQTLLSMGFSRQEYWNGLPWPPPGELPDLGIEPMSPVPPPLQADSSTAEPSEQIFHHYLKHGGRK